MVIQFINQTLKLFNIFILNNTKTLGHLTPITSTTLIYMLLLSCKGFPGGAGGKEPGCQCRRPKRREFNPWVRKMIPGEGHGNPLQYSCLGELSPSYYLWGHWRCYVWCFALRTLPRVPPSPSVHTTPALSEVTWIHMKDNKCKTE